MDSEKAPIKIFSLNKIVTAFLIGVLIEIIRRGDSPATGPLDIIFVPIFSGYYSAKFLLLSIIAGLLFYIPQLKNIWFNNKFPFIIVLIVGIVLFCYGKVTAKHIYWNLHRPGIEADVYLEHFAIPGEVLILFSLSFRPFKLFRSSRSKK
ncbi:MAG TPA: hypothetical protein VFF27_16930 [Bacteroidia bacterium]|jgi:hypothetical protein|nr:hypothetical protein [Bacteroidia bacterium]